MGALFIGLLFFFGLGDGGGSASPVVPPAGGGGGTTTPPTGGSGGTSGPPGGTSDGKPAPKSGPPDKPSTMLDAAKMADEWGAYAVAESMVPDAIAMLAELAWLVSMLAEGYLDVLRQTKRPEDATTVAGAAVELESLNATLQVGTDSLEAAPGNAAGTARVIEAWKGLVRVANSLSTLLDRPTRLEMQRRLMGDRSNASWSVPPTGLLRFARDLGLVLFADRFESGSPPRWAAWGVAA